MRTLPAYYTILLLTVLQQYATKDNVSFPYEYLFFLQNYAQSMDIFYVSWSLAVEEQFYFVIAPLIALSVRATPKHTLILLLIADSVPQLLRLLDANASSTMTHVRLDGCATGFHIHPLPEYMEHACSICPISRNCVNSGVVLLFRGPLQPSLERA